jgi:putative transposase
MEPKFNIHPKLIEELSKHIKTEKDLSELSRHLVKMTVEKAMDVELTEHLGYEKHAVEGKNGGNSRNGHSAKTLKGSFGEVQIITPRDRQSTFEPALIRKGQTRITQFDEQILALYARGMTTRDIAATFKEMYDAEVSHNVISKVTESVIEEVIAWQNRPLSAVYPFLYLDCIVIKCHQWRALLDFVSHNHDPFATSCDRNILFLLNFCYASNDDVSHLSHYFLVVSQYQHKKIVYLASDIHN